MKKRIKAIFLPVFLLKALEQHSVSYWLQYMLRKENKQTKIKDHPLITYMEFILKNYRHGLNSILFSLF